MAATSKETPGRVDLTGRTIPWPGPAVELWRSCLADATAGVGVWPVAPRGGHPLLRKALGEHLGVDPNRLAITSGVRSVTRALLAGSSRLIIERPTFLDIAVLARLSGLRVTLADLPAILGGRATDADATLWVTHPARNPDGRTLAVEELDQLARLAPRYRRIVINRAYHWSRPEPFPAQVTTVGTLHKLAGGGMQVGWVWPVDKSYWSEPLDGGPPWSWQIALASFVAASGLDLLVPGYQQAGQRRRAAAERLREALPPGATVSSAGDGLHLLLSVPNHRPDDSLVDCFARAGLAVSPGTAFAAPATSVRLAFTSVNDDDISLIVPRIAGVIAHLAR